MEELKVEVTTYKGHNILNITKGDTRIFSGGFKKAKAIFDISSSTHASEELKKFVEENTKSE